MGPAKLNEKSLHNENNLKFTKNFLAFQIHKN